MQQEFKYIYQVYQDGSFLKAAEHLFITQPALSIAVQKVESSIGMALFDRSKRPLTLTPAGEIYIRTIEKIQHLEHDLNQELYDIQTLNTGTIRLGGSHYLNAYILPNLLAGFSQKYPGIQFEITEESSDHLSELLLQRNIDLTFSCNPFYIQKFEHYASFHDHILLAIPSCYPLSPEIQKIALSPRDVINRQHLSPSCLPLPLESVPELEYILLTPGNNLYERAQVFFQDAGITPHIKLHLSQMATAYRLAMGGFAATFISDYMVTEPDVPLTFFKLSSHLSTRLFYILLPKQAYTSSAVKSFIQYFNQNF